MKTRLSLLVLLVLAACSVPLAPTPTAEAPILSPGGADRPDEGLPAGAVLVLQRSGGIAGLSERWVVYADGRLENSSGRQWQAAPQEVARLVADVERLGFFELDSRYVPLNTCCDRFLYELTVRSGERSHTVTVLEATPDVPAELWEALGAVERWIAAASGQ